MERGGTVRRREGKRMWVSLYRSDHELTTVDEPKNRIVDQRKSKKTDKKRKEKEKEKERKRRRHQGRSL